MKILHTADWHVGRTIRGRSRAGEHRAVLAEMIGIATAESVDLVVVAGDLFDTAAPTAESETLVYRALLDLAQVAPVVAVAGNHDHPQRLDAVTPLLDLGRVVMASEVRSPDDGGVIRHPDVPDTRIVLLPFLSQRSIVRADDLMSKDADRHGGKYAGRFGRIVERLCEDAVTDDVNLVVSHLMVHGGETGGGERDAHTVFDYSVSAGVFPSVLSYVALGHLHRPQQIPSAAPVWYSGAPLQLDFGEAGIGKQVLVVEVEPGLPATVTPHRLESGVPLVQISGTLAQIESATVDLGEAYVKVVVDEPGRAGLADEVRRMVPGAVDVILDPSRRDDRDRPRTERSGLTHSELFEAYLAEGDIEDPSLVSLFGEMLDQAHET